MKRLLLAVLALAAWSGCARSAPDELDAAIRELRYRPVEGRLSGLPHALPPGMRRESDAAIFAELNARRAAQPQRFIAEPDAVRARAALFAGNLRDSQTLLQKVTASGTASAAVWNDYAVTLHAGTAPNDALQLAAALAAVDRALELSPDLREALFNRGLMLETMSAHAAAVTAYKKYLATDASSPWANEARARIRTLDAAQARIASWHDYVDDLERAAEAGDELFINDVAISFPGQSRRWCNLYLERWGERLLAGNADGAASMLLLCRVIGRALENEHGDSLLAETVRIIEGAPDPRPLARGHMAYARGRKALQRREHDRALDALHEADALFRQHDSPMSLAARLSIVDATPDGNDAMLRRLADDTPMRYRGLQAEIQRLLGISATQNDRHGTAVESLRSAAATFEALGDQQELSRIRNLTTTALTKKGDLSAGWREVGTSLASAGDDQELAFALYAAARLAAAEERWDVVHALLNVVVETPRVSSYLRAEAMAWRMVAAHRANMPRAAAAELTAARKAEQTSSDLVLAEALLATHETAIELLTDSLGVARDDTMIARLLVARARAFQDGDQSESAKADLERAVELLARGNVAIASTDIRGTILGSPLEAYSMLADALDRAGNTPRAAEILEHFRAWPRRPPTETIHIRLRASGANTVIVSYALFADRVVIHANDHRIAVQVRAEDVKRLVTHFIDAIERNDARGIRSNGHALSRILIDPIASLVNTGDVLIVVPDRELAGLPFGALSRFGRRYLIEDHPVVLSSSITAWSKASRPRGTGSRSVLAVGNAQSDGVTVSLPLAEAEATEIAAMYPSRALLTSAAATKRRVISALAYSDTAHFAVHANAGLGDRAQPHLLLSATAADDGRLTAGEIAALNLDNMHTVVLAGCETVAGARSLVDAFLEGGAANVVGTLWEVDDAGTREMSVAFHRALRDGATAAEALRTTQREMIRREVPMRVWAALQLYGSGS